MGAIDIVSSEDLCCSSPLADEVRLENNCPFLEGTPAGMQHWTGLC